MARNAAMASPVSKTRLTELTKAFVVEGVLAGLDARPDLLAARDDKGRSWLHLIAAHHGFARPILRTDGCDDAPPSALVERARTIALRFARLEERWGPWGLAWWETLLRAADSGASRENDERGGQRG